MGAGAAEAVIKIEVAEGRIEVVAPEQVNHAAAKPDAFRDCRPGRSKHGYASAISSIFFWVSLAASAAGFCGSGGLPFSALRESRRTVRPKAATQDSTVNN